MNKTNLIYKFNAPLNPNDTDQQTQGCRAFNPNICSNADMPNICAFVRTDCICIKPSKAWKKQFYKLIKKQNSPKYDQNTH